MWDIQNTESHSAGRLQLLLTVQNPNCQIRFLTHHESFARPKIVPPVRHKYLYVHFMLISLWTPEHLVPKPCAKSNADVWLWGLPGGPVHLKGVGWGSGPNSLQAGQVCPLKPGKTISQMDTVMSKHKRWHWNVTGPTHCGQVCKRLSPCLYHNMIYLLFITHVTVCSMMGGKLIDHGVKWSVEILKWSDDFRGNLVSLLERWSHSNTQQKLHLDVLLWLDREHIPRLLKFEIYWPNI